MATEPGTAGTDRYTVRDRAPYLLNGAIKPEELLLDQKRMLGILDEGKRNDAAKDKVIRTLNILSRTTWDKAEGKAILSETGFGQPHEYAAKFIEIFSKFTRAQSGTETLTTEEQMKTTIHDMRMFLDTPSYPIETLIDSKGNVNERRINEIKEDNAIAFVKLLVETHKDGAFILETLKKYTGVTSAGFVSQRVEQAIGKL